MRAPWRDRPQPSTRVREIGDLPRFREVIDATSILGPVPPRVRESEAAARRAFLDEAARMRQGRAARPTTVGFQLLRAVAPAAALLLVLLGLLGGTIAAAQAAAPDSPLYRGKLAWEDVRLALATDPQTQADLALRFAETRGAEIQALVAADLPVPEAVRLRLEAQMQQVLRNAAQLPDIPLNQFLARMEVRVQQQVQAISQTMAGAPEQHRAALQWTVMVLERTREMAALGQNDPAAFRQMGGLETGFLLTVSPTPLGLTPTGTPAAETPSAAPVTVGQGPGPGQEAGPEATPGGSRYQTPQPTCPAWPTPGSTLGRPDNTPGQPDNTPGRPDNTPGQPDNASGGEGPRHP